MSTENKPSIVLLLSGGIDSTVLLHRLLFENWDVYPLHINYGQITANIELSTIRKIINYNLKNELLTLNIKEVQKVGDGALVGCYPAKLYSASDWYEAEFFPNRNTILMTLAATYCYKIGCSNLAIGVVGENSYGDTKKGYLKAVENILTPVENNPIKIYAPYAELSRIKVIEDAVKFDVDLELTFSCNALGDRHCYYCVSCKEREETLISYKKIKSNQ